MRILITGATGLIGREVGKILAGKGHEVFVVSRSKSKALEILPFPCQVIVADLSKGRIVDPRMESIEAVINLMGETIAGERWTETKKKKIHESRVIGTRNLVASLPKNLRCFVSGSAMGFYGDTGEKIASESAPAGSDFLAQVCKEWEEEAAKAPGRRVSIRTSIVLARHGGALDQMLLPFRAGVGGALGSGQQWMSWIHLHDIVNLFVFALENPQVSGALNGSAPQPVRNKDFSREFAKALGKWLGPNVPALALKLLFGELADSLMASNRLSATRVQELGFKFEFEFLIQALGDVCEPFKKGEEEFYAEQFVPAPPEKLFSFFKEAHNLEAITPPTLNFSLVNMSTPAIGQGTLLDYRLKIHGVPANWRTEIDEWEPPYKFVDNQLRGPYRKWHHTHEFRPFCGGTLMIDCVRYRLPLGFIGWLAGSQFIRKDVENIFAFRRKYIAKMDLERL